MIELDNTLSVHEAVYRALRWQIMIGHVTPGKNLTLRGISALFKVSMTPVRESVRRLNAEGAIILSSSGRISVPELNNERIEELFVLRSLLEPELSSRALPRVHNALIERLTIINDLIDKLILKKDSIGYLQRNIEFHKTLYLRAQSPAILASLENVWLQLGPMTRRLYDKEIQNKNTFNHKKILSSLQSGDDTSLRLSIRTDVLSGLNMILG